MKFQKELEEIKKLHEQGASAIAKKGVMAFAQYVSEGKNYKKDIEYAKKELLKARPTEPMLANGMNYIIEKAKSKNDFLSLAQKLIEKKEESEKTISEVGAGLIKDGMHILTHCHSSSVLRVLKKAKEQGKKFSVMCFETRPLFQGRLTAKKLVDMGIRTTLTIDSAMADAFEEFHADLVLIGCDALTKNYFVNKIGTNALAQIAKKNNVPLYVCTETFKFTDNLRIEPREKKELWEKAPKSLHIWNPAFDIISNKLAKGFVTQQGIKKEITCLSW